MRGLPARRVEDEVNDWLIQEGFLVKRLEAPPEARISWGLDVNTPPPVQVNFKVFKTVDKPDRMVLLVGVMVSPEHRKFLEGMKREEVLKFMSRLTRVVLSVCGECQLAIQPNILDPQSLSVADVLFDAELAAHGKPLFIKRVIRLLNAYSAIVSVFNEAYPVIPQERGERGAPIFA